MRNCDPCRHTRVAVGASSTKPSDETHNTSWAPRALAPRSDALLAAYDSVFAPPSSHGAVARNPAGIPNAAVNTLTPSVRARIEASDTPPTVAKTVTGPGFVSEPRVQMRRRAPSRS